MLQQSHWEPRLAQSGTSPSDRLVTALADDILEGRLTPTDRLPAHRDLAQRLGIGIGTVTKAYGILERRGLVRTVSGSGTFVSAAVARKGRLIDLSRNGPPIATTERLLSKAMTSAAKSVDLNLFTSYGPVGGHDEHRRQFCYWLSRLGIEVESANLLLTDGAQGALAAAFSVACGRDGVIFTECQTHPGAVALARHNGYRIIGLKVDDEGVMPGELERSLAAFPENRKVLYVTPMVQNPTTSTMSNARREDIVRVCRAADVLIVEDDVYRQIDSLGVTTLRDMAPERVFYVNSLSKTLNPAFRIGALVPPPIFHAKCERAMEALATVTSPFAFAVFEQWLKNGVVDDLTASIQKEARRRVELARSILGSHVRTSDQFSYHVWLPLQDGRASYIEELAKALGVLVTPPSLTAADPLADSNGLRLCLGSPDYSDLTSALQRIAGLLSDADDLRGEVRQPI